jgi:beta-fructofuranosidase
MDLHRPQYHFLPPNNWMNDPNGLIHWNGRYHLFYQHNPYAPVHGNIHWGHASSVDLVHWQHEPIALMPDAAGPDADGCWSGCAVVAAGVPMLLYSGHRQGRELPCLAMGSADLRHWQKYTGNPLLAAPPPELDLLGFRDHSVWREADWWYMLIGAGIRDRGGAALLYRSHDLIHWDYRGPLLIGDAQAHEPVWTGRMWECPDLFALVDRHVLLVSAWDGEPHATVAMIGTYEAEQFTPQQSAPFDYGAPCFYAPQSFYDAQGRRLVFGWAMEGRSSAAQQAAGWAGVMSLPRELTLSATGQLIQRPVAEVQLLRRQQYPWRGMALHANQEWIVPQVRGAALELDLEILPAAGGTCSIVLRRSPDGAEQTRISYSAIHNSLTIDCRQASLDQATDRPLHTIPLTLGVGEPLRLRIFLDHSMLEVFANDQIACTTRIYPTRADSIGIALAATDHDAWLHNLDLWTMAEIW